MAEIKRVNIYMGVVGQAYVDKETALANLNAAIKNVHDMEEIIASAQEQQPVAENALAKAEAAKNLAQTAYDQLSSKFNAQNEEDALYVRLLNIINDLNLNDTDKNPYNGGSTKTAQENIDDINKQITELAQIITDGQESLQRRIAFVDELQIVYDNALEKFKSYLPEEDGYDWDAWDEEEEILKARIQAVIDALKNANSITDAINSTSKETILRAVDVILEVCNNNDAVISNLYNVENNYVNELNNILDQLNVLHSEAAQYDYTYNGELLKNNITNDIDVATTYKDELIEAKIPSINDLGHNVNSQVIIEWENVKNSINEQFNVNEFSGSVENIYYINSQIKQHKQFISEIISVINRLNKSIANYETELQNIKDSNPEVDYPKTIEINGITYYRNDQGNPGEGYYQVQEQYNGVTYYAWILNEEWVAAPDTIVINGITYSKRWTEAPGEGYEMDIQDANGIQYYAWIPSAEPQPQPQPGVDQYFYVGTTKPASLSEATIVDSYLAEQTYTNNSGENRHIFVLTNSDKTVTFINPQLNAPVDQLDVDTTTISGYNIFETAVGTAIDGSIKIMIS